MKHSECSDCTHRISTYESQYRLNKTKVWAPWSRVVLGSGSPLRMLLDQSEFIKYVTRTYTDGMEHRYRKLK
jgi:hypothetical protein